MTLAGITSVGEFHYLHHDAGGRRYADPNAMGHALIDGATDAGLRLTLLDTCYLSSAPDGTPLNDGPQQRFGDGSGAGWAERVEALHQQVQRPEDQTYSSAPHCIPCEAYRSSTCPPWSNGPTRTQRPLHVHSSEQRAEIDQCIAAHGRTPTAVLKDAGALGARTTAVHATHLTAEDIGDLDDTATGVCFCPTTERDLGDGIGPAPALLETSGLFSLGSDSHAVIDMFEEARAVELDERLAREQRGIIGASTLLHAATVGGQHALGWTDAGQLPGRGTRGFRCRGPELRSHRGRRRDTGDGGVRGIGLRRHRRGDRRPGRGGRPPPRQRRRRRMDCHSTEDRGSLRQP